MTRDPRVDAYIARQADFARPILDHLRACVRSVCPETEETLKWGMPNFLYKGKILANMAAFKSHAAFGFWRGREIVGASPEKESMGQFGRLASLADLPAPDQLAALVRKAMAVIDSGPAPKKPPRAPRPELLVPEALKAALDADPRAAATFYGFAPSCRREYVEWVAEAKRAETRDKRVAQAVEWMAEGKKRNWKYENC